MSLTSQEGGQTSQAVLPNCQQREPEAGAAAPVLGTGGQAVAGGSAFAGSGLAHPDGRGQPPLGSGSGGGREPREVWKPAWRHRRVEVGEFLKKTHTQPRPW